MKVVELMNKLEDIMHDLSWEDENAEVKIHPNTYKLSYFLSIPGQGFINLNEIIKEEEDD